MTQDRTVRGFLRSSILRLKAQEDWCADKALLQPWDFFALLHVVLKTYIPYTRGFFQLHRLSNGSSSVIDEADESARYAARG